MTSVTVYASTVGAGRPRFHEERVLRVRVAGAPRRFLAALVDLVLVLAATVGVTLGAALALRVPLPSSAEMGPDLLLAGVLDRNPMALGALGVFLGLSVLYQLYFGGMSGQTIGKRLMGIRIISVRGRAPGPSRGTVRLFGLALSLALAGLGWLWAFFDREHRGLHDHLAGTYVVLDDDA